jgi:hypothetical protein
VVEGCERRGMFLGPGGCPRSRPTSGLRDNPAPVCWEGCGGAVGRPNGNGWLVWGASGGVAYWTFRGSFRTLRAGLLLVDLTLLVMAVAATRPLVRLQARYQELRLT